MIATLHLLGRHEHRLEELAADWEDEAAAASLAGNPRRGDYLSYMAGRVPQLVFEAGEREQQWQAREAKLAA